MKIKNIEKRGNRKEGVNLIIEVLEKDVIPKGNRKLLNRRNFYKQHLTSLGFSHVRGKYVIQLDDENEIETMKHYLNLIGQNTRVIQTVIFVQEITERSFLIKIVQSSKIIIYVHTAEDS